MYVEKTELPLADVAKNKLLLMEFSRIVFRQLLPAYPFTGLMAKPRHVAYKPSTPAALKNKCILFKSYGYFC